MKRNSDFMKSTAVFLAGIVLFTSCASTTLIQSNPAGAKVYIDGEAVGVTPYRYNDTKIVGSSTNIELVKEGYQPLQTSFSRSEQADAGAIIGGLFFLVPFLWTMKYKPVHNYELLPLDGNNQPVINTTSEPVPPVQNAPQAPTTKTKMERLKELKDMYDAKLITKEDYEKQKQKILDEN